MEKTVEAPFRIIIEVDFGVDCVIHGGGANIRFNVRALPLGYGRAYIDLGNATCLKCGHSTYLTIRTVETKWEDIPAETVRKLMKAALEEEMGRSIGEELEPDPEEEVIQPESASTGPALPAPARPKFPALGKRPGLQ